MNREEWKEAHRIARRDLAGFRLINSLRGDDDKIANLPMKPEWGAYTVYGSDLSEPVAVMANHRLPLALCQMRIMRTGSLVAQAVHTLSCPDCRQAYDAKGGDAATTKRLAREALEEVTRLRVKQMAVLAAERRALH